jgi:hypothetical protein
MKRSLPLGCVFTLTVRLFAQQMVSDEQRLRDIQEGLARAWKAGDRAYLERVIAPEWTVVQPDGSIVTRDTQIQAYIGGPVKVESIEMNDVRVDIFDGTAVVRGRTAVTASVNGVRTNFRLRFMDVFLKRESEWQAVASQATPLP